MQQKTQWIFLAEGERSFSLQNPHLLHKMMEPLKDKGIAVAIYYNPLIHKDLSFFDPFDAALPLLDWSLVPAGALVLDKTPPEELPAPLSIISDQDHPKISVIVRVRNGEDILPQTLKALASQTVKNMELHVIDSGSEDKSIAIAQHFGAIVKSIPAAAYFPGKVLNDAIKDTSTDLIVFLNSDCVMLTPTSLENLLKRFQDPLVSGAFGRQLPRPDAELWVSRDYHASFPPAQPPHWMHMSLCLAAMRRCCWNQHPFYLQAWGSEDTQWAVQAKQRGEIIAYVPEAIVMHSHNYNLVQLYGRRFIEGEADAFIFDKSYSAIACALDFLKGFVRETFLYVKNGAWRKILQILPRRFVYSWAYYKGFRWGTHRKKNNDTDGSRGQKEVLTRYDDESN